MSYAVSTNDATVAQRGSAVTQVFGDLIAKTLGMSEPDEEQVRLIRIVEAAWYGVLMSALNHHITTDECEADTRLACRRLLNGV